MRIKKLEAYVGTPKKALKAVTSLRTKAGGLPVFCEPTAWPKCTQCGQDMDFVIQIDLKSPKRLARTHDFAYLFMCFRYGKDGNLTCESYWPHSGANAVLLQHKSAVPVVAAKPAARVYPEFVFDFERFQDPDIDAEDPEVDEKLLEQLCDDNERIKLGGRPRWLQTDETPDCPRCETPMKAVAQIGQEIGGRYGCDSREWKKIFHFDFGRAHVFLCGACRDPSAACALWQCD